MLGFPRSRSARTWAVLPAVALLTTVGVAAQAPHAAAALPPQLTFTNPGSYVWVVPQGATTVEVTLAGGQGGSGAEKAGPGGLGATVFARLPLAPNTIVLIDVAGACGVGSGGYGGGGAGGSDGLTQAYSGGGGGASRIRVTNNGPVMAVAGGGGGGATFSVAGGNSGQPGSKDSGTWSGQGGGPGTAVSGGAGGVGGVAADLAPGCESGVSGSNGTSGTSFAGGTGGDSPHPAPGGGGGGGGYFGGGGGGGGPLCQNIGSGGGGGGGSTYVIPTATDVVVTQGVRAGNGEVTIAYLAPTATTGQPPAILGSAPDATLRTPYSYAYPLSSEATVSLQDGTLPPGLTLSTEGVLSGTPKKPGTYTFTVAARNHVATALLSETLTVLPAPVANQADLGLAVSGARTGSVGSELTYRVSAVNHGPGTALSATTSVTIPSGWDFVSASGTGRQVGSHIEWTETTLVPNQAVAYELTLRPTRDRDVVLRADVNARGVDPEPGNNRASVPVTIG